MASEELLNLDPSTTGSTPLLLEGFWQVFLAGCLGGIAADVLLIIEHRHTTPPAYLKSVFYWVSLAVLAVAGGGLTIVYGVHNIQALLAINIGASAPLILKSLASSVPRLSTGKID